MKNGKGKNHAKAKHENNKEDYKDDLIPENENVGYSYIPFDPTSVFAKDGKLGSGQELRVEVPFDDQINYQAKLDNFELDTIREYLQSVKSSLFEISHRMPFLDICRALRIVKGPADDPRPVNVGLLFFYRIPERYFPQCWIVLSWHPDGSDKCSTDFFRGPLPKQLREALAFFSTNIIGERVIKRPDKAEADRFYNFPYRALEEVLLNAVCYKNYDLSAPVHIQVWPDKILVLSCPVSVCSSMNENIFTDKPPNAGSGGNNHRIYEFLRALYLADRSRGNSATVFEMMENNGSPAPVFETDDRTYMLVTLKIHEGY